jgi:D-sedoheptulose 7-phosphate isomerase
MIDLVNAAMTSAADALANLRKNDAALAAVAAAGELLVKTFQNGGRVYSCGNGGSMCDAMHFAEELSGKFRRERAALPAMAISDSAHLTCAANDFGFDSVFSRFVEAHGRRGDVLLAISTSGNSPNILAAATAAHAAGMKVIALTGKPGNKLEPHADINICTPGGTQYSDRIQELHIKVIHTLIELCESRLFPAGV